MAQRMVSSEGGAWWPWCCVSCTGEHLGSGRRRRWLVDFRTLTKRWFSFDAPSVLLVCFNGGAVASSPFILLVVFFFFLIYCCCVGFVIKATLLSPCLVLDVDVCPTLSSNNRGDFSHLLILFVSDYIYIYVVSFICHCLKFGRSIDLIYER